MKANATSGLLPSRSVLERALEAKDASYDGTFYFAVKTTGIFCRPSCPSQPKLENLEFFASAGDCLAAGYRPCKRCHPMELIGERPAWVAELMARVETAPDAPLRAVDLSGLGVTPERARRWFRQRYGMSFSEWCRGRRLAGAFSQLREGAPVDEATFGSGYESHSGFREAFARAFGAAPGQSRQAGERVVMDWFDSPLGTLLAGARDDGLCLLHFTDGRDLERTLEETRRRFGCGVVPGEHPVLDQARAELEEYFAGRRKDFAVPLAARGTPFQERVWRELRVIPYGQTIAYDQLARRIEQPTAQRAVARANGANRICILIPCHRVIGKDGTLTGYGGGLWRKRLLLELERSGRVPGGSEAAIPCEPGGAANV